MTIWLFRTSPRLHLDTLTQQCKYEFTLEPDDHMIIKNLPRLRTSPKAVDSTMRIRIHPRTRGPNDLGTVHLDFTFIRWLSNANTNLPQILRKHCDLNNIRWVSNANTRAMSNQTTRIHDFANFVLFVKTSSAHPRGANLRKNTHSQRPQKAKTK